MVNFISGLVNNDILATFLMSILPLIELKGGILFAHGVNPPIPFIEAFLLAYLGSTIAFILVFFLLKPILALLKKIKGVGRFADKIENYFIKKADETKIKRRKGKEVSDIFIKQLGVFIFVAVPLPMTGVWAGTGVAVFLNLKFKEAIVPIALGNLVAGTLISILAIVCSKIWGIESLNVVLWCLLILAIVLFALTVIKISLSKKDKKEE